MCTSFTTSMTFSFIHTLSLSLSLSHSVSFSSSSSSSPSPSSSSSSGRSRQWGSVQGRTSVNPSSLVQTARQVLQLALCYKCFIQLWSSWPSAAGPQCTSGLNGLIDVILRYDDDDMITLI